LRGSAHQYTIPEIKDLLWGHSEDAQQWLTTSQVGWALTRERNELTNERDERHGIPVAKQLAPMISKFIWEQCEMQDFENIENDNRQILEEEAELDHIWGVWEEEAETISDAAGWLQQASLNKGDLRHHVEARKSHREQW
jgi:hypothetical protein